MNTNRPSDANPPNVIQFFGFESADRAVTLFGREAPPTMPQHVSRSFKQCERVLSSRMNTNRPSDANPPKVIQFFGFESDDRGVTLSGRGAPPAMPQHLSRAADSGNAPGELAST